MAGRYNARRKVTEKTLLTLAAGANRGHTPDGGAAGASALTVWRSASMRRAGAAALLASVVSALLLAPARGFQAIANNRSLLQDVLLRNSQNAYYASQPPTAGRGGVGGLEVQVQFALINIIQVSTEKEELELQASRLQCGGVRERAPPCVCSESLCCAGQGGLANSDLCVFAGMRRGGGELTGWTRASCGIHR